MNKKPNIFIFFFLLIGVSLMTLFLGYQLLTVGLNTTDAWLFWLLLIGFFVFFIAAPILAFKWIMLFIREKIGVDKFEDFLSSLGTLFMQLLTDEGDKKIKIIGYVIYGISVSYIFFMTISSGHQLFSSDLSTMETWRYRALLISFICFAFMSFATIVAWIVFFVRKKNKKQLSVS